MDSAIGKFSKATVHCGIWHRRIEAATSQMAGAKVLGHSPVAAPQDFALMCAKGPRKTLGFEAPAPLLRPSRSCFFLCNAAAERVHEVHSVLRPRRGMLPRYRQAGLLLLEHLDNRFLVVINKLRGVEVGRFALEDVLGQLEHIRLDLHFRNVVEIFLRIPDLVWIAER